MSERGHFSSALEWLSGAPKTWETKPLYSVGFENKKRNKGLTEQNLLSLSYGRVIDKDINSDSGLLPESFDSYQIVEPGDLIFRFTDLQNDQRSLRSGLVKSRGIITSAYLGFRPVGAHPEFLAYLIHAYDVNKVFYGVGSGLRQSLNWQDVRTMPVPVPSIQDQIALTQYLDQETSRIDALISKKEQLIEKLLERRQALITQVVTKGLDPNVPMKDSGVKWLGEVPKGWTTKPIWSISKAFAGGTPESSNPEYWDDAEGTPWIAIGDMSDVTRVLSTSKAVSMLGRTIKRLPFGEPGDVLFAMYASVGATAILGIRATWNQAILGLRIDSRLADEKFVFFLLKGISDVWNLLSNSNTQSNLNQHSVMHLRISLPGKSEQAKIAAYLDQETSQMDTLVEKTRRAIELLKERRQALITQVVTGKIDVRGFAGGNS